VVSISGDTEFQVDRRVRLLIPAKAMLFFDSATGRRI